MDNNEKADFIWILICLLSFFFLFFLLVYYSNKEKHSYENYLHSYLRIEESVPSVLADWEDTVTIDGDVVKFSGKDSIYIFSVKDIPISVGDGVYESFAQSRKSGKFYSVKFCFNGRYLYSCSKPSIVKDTDLAFILMQSKRPELVKILDLKVSSF